MHTAMAERGKRGIEMEEKLLFKPCPFCGGLYMGAYAVKEDSTRCSALIRCAACGAQTGKTYSYDGETKTAVNDAIKL